MPPLMIDKIKNFGLSTKRLSMSTVEGFIKDTNKAKFKL